MIGIIVATHSNLCYGFRDAAKMIGCFYENVDYISLTEEGIDLFEKKMSNSVREMHEKYSNLIVMTDLLSATPYNTACKVICNYGYENDYVIAGINLGMFMELVITSQFEENIAVIADKAESTGKNSVCLVNPVSYYSVENDTDEEDF